MQPYAQKINNYNLGPIEIPLISESATYNKFKRTQAYSENRSEGQLFCANSLYLGSSTKGKLLLLFVWRRPKDTILIMIWPIMASG